MKAHFLLDAGLFPLKGSLFYNVTDSACDFEPFQHEQLMQRSGIEGVTSVTVGTLQTSEIVIRTLEQFDLFNKHIVR